MSRKSRRLKAPSNLEMRRRLAGLTQKELARRSGVSDGRLSEVERGIKGELSPALQARVDAALSAARIEVFHRQVFGDESHRSDAAPRES
jgi:transcriptional regulator with XRE-family HTH domain